MSPSDHAEEIERLAERAARDPRTHTFARLADLYRKVGELDRALQVIEAGLKHHPHYLNARLVHARLLRDLGRPEEAVAAFTRVLEIDSENRVARAALEELTGEPFADEDPARSAAPPPASVGWLARLDAEWRHTVAENGADAASSDAVSAAAPPTEAPPAVDELSREASGPELPQEPRSQEEADGGDGPETLVAAAAEVDDDDAEVEVAEVDAADIAAPDEAGVAADEAREAPAETELETGTLAALYVTQGLFDQAVAIYERLLARDPYNARLAAALEDARQRGGTRRERGSPEPGPRPGAAAPPEPEPEATVETRGESAGPPFADYLKALLEGRAPVEETAGGGRRWPDWLREIG